MHRLLARHWGKYELTQTSLPAQLAAPFEAYFQGQLSALEPLPVLTRGTEFQHQVWQALRTIGPGQTLSYVALAAQVERPKAVRAVGAANGANPVGLVVPCHRVIGANGSLTGYGGGVERKRWLLDHEATHSVRVNGGAGPPA